MNYQIETGVDDYGQRFVTGSIDGREVISIGESKRMSEVVWRVNSSTTLPVYPDKAEIVVRVQQLAIEEMNRIKDSE